MQTGRASRRVIGAALAMLTAVLGAVSAGASSPAILPHQQFAGLVNGKGNGVAVSIACYGPIKPGMKGHPTSGQTLEVVLAEVLATAGNTGSHGSAIVAHFTDARSSSIRFSDYGITQPIPTSLLLPCGGSGTVMFVPAPSSTGAKSFTVTVNFVGQP